MGQRLVEMFVQRSEGEAAEALLREKGVGLVWREDYSVDKALLRVLVDAGQTDAVLELLENRFGATEDFHAFILPVEATLPRPKEPETPAEVDEAAKLRQAYRVSIEEVRQRVGEMIGVNRIFLLVLVLSTITAAIGLYRSNTAIVIGAMVIAPLLGPNVALALATTLADLRLARRALYTAGVGIGGALAIAVVLGVLQPLNPTTLLESPEFVSRTDVGLSDIALALVVGAAGALAVTSVVSSALVGVMVAVALLPPIVVLGVLMGSQLWGDALGAALLVGVNLGAINLAGVVTFYAQGVRPKRYWEAERASRMMRWASILWLLVLLALAALILYNQKRPT
jgi:uncharacterized hydrophobic protein (TIGR00341 family)